MEHDHGPPAEGAASFHTARWTIVMRAAQSQAPGGESTLAQLCRTYWYPLYMFARRLKRGGDKEFVMLDAEEAEEHYRLEPVGRLTAEKMFDARWAMILLAEALKRLEPGRFFLGNVFLNTVNCRATPSYEEIVSRLQVSTGAVKTLIHRLRKRYTALLREEIGRTVSDPAEIDEEIHPLCEAFIASERRLGP